MKQNKKQQQAERLAVSKQRRQHNKRDKYIHLSS